jgi:hypothetical protein
LGQDSPVFEHERSLLADFGATKGREATASRAQLEQSFLIH